MMLAFLSVLFLAYHLPVNVKAEFDLLDPTERLILIQFYNGTVGTDRWKQGCDAGWATYDADTCSWQGITCNAEGTHVTSINIGACNLVGTIPSTPAIPSIFGLKFVEQICLSPGPDQFLSGNLPDDFNNQTPVLKQIQLTGHKLGGRLPPSLYKATSIQRIDLHSNQLQGSISEDIGNLVMLIYLSVANNKMDGPIPRSFAKLDKLATLGLAQNSFTGDVEPLSNLESLTILFLRHNLLEGALPMVAGSVQVFDVDYNTFAGVSPELCKDQNQMKALKQFGGCGTDWPNQPLGTCCMANNNLNESVKAQCPALANCFPSPVTTYFCDILTDTCVPVAGPTGEFPTLGKCEELCSKLPTPAPAPPVCTGESANLTASDCAAWVTLFSFIVFALHA